MHVGAVGIENVHFFLSFVTVTQLCLPSCYSWSGPEQLPRKDASKTVLTLGTFLLRAPTLSVTFLLHLSLFPRGLKSLSLCFRVATALPGLTDSLHPFSKQRSEAQMLTHEHRSIRFRNLLSCKQQMRATPVASAHEQFAPATSLNLIHAIFEWCFECIVSMSSVCCFCLHASAG